MFRARTGTVESVTTSGIWLSPWDMGENHHDQTLSMETGDILFLYTDGITEARKGDSSMFGEEGLIRILEASGNSHAADIRDRVIAELKGYQVKDDITMVILKKVASRP